MLTYKNHVVEIKKEGIDAGNVRLTEDGQRLYKIIGKREQDKIFEYTIERLQYRNCNINITRKESKYTGNLF